MSARQWKVRLEECQQKLGEATLAAAEWKTVAENRLKLLRRLDSTLSHNLEDLVRVGEIFGLSVDFEDGVWTETHAMDGGLVAMYAMGKLEAVADYQAGLLKEASSIQLTLNDTYTLACEATVVARPTVDLFVPPDTEKTSQPSSPYRDVETQLNNLPENTVVPLDHYSPVERPTEDNDLSFDGSTALSLFKRK